MLNRRVGKWLQGALLCLLALMMTAPDVFAELIKGPKLPFWFWGVNSYGNLDPSLGGPGTGKYYKYTDANFIVGSGKAKVTNESGERAVFENLGLPVIDPETDDEYVTTFDIYDVRRRRGVRRAKVTAFGVYFPGYED